LRVARYIAGSLLLFLMLSIVATSALKSSVSADGFPTGQVTPEGVASDLARAFANGDAALFQKICIPPYGSGPSRAEYIHDLDGVSQHLRNEGLGPSPDDPRKILRVFAARHLSKNGPASYGYATFDFQDLMFVDVEVELRSGPKHRKRTLVINDHDGRWYAHPMPDVSPLLSVGLYHESASTRLYTDPHD
jgi:hypothetical protein